MYRQVGGWVSVCDVQAQVGGCGTCTDTCVGVSLCDVQTQVGGWVSVYDVQTQMGGCLYVMYRHRWVGGYV